MIELAPAALIKFWKARELLGLFWEGCDRGHSSCLTVTHDHGFSVHPLFAAHCRFLITKWNLNQVWS